MEEFEIEDFNPIHLKINNYDNPTEYKNDFFLKNIVEVSEYYELKILQTYFSYGFLSIGHIFKASEQLSHDENSEITYRKVNDWSVKGLFEESRNSKVKWRKYTVPQAVQLLLINDLKKFGYSNEQINSITQQIFFDKCEILKDCEIFNYRYFDFYASTYYKRGINFSLLIDCNCNTYILTDTDLMLNISDGIDKTKPFLVLPFSKYLSVFAKDVFGRENEGVITEEFSSKKILPSSNERKILENVRDEKIFDIKINRKSKNKSLVMKSTKIKNDEVLSDDEVLKLLQNDEYITTSITKKKGNKYNLRIEETEKLD